MTTVRSDAVTAGIMPNLMKAGGILNRIADYTVVTSALANGTTIEMVPIPKDAKIVDMKLSVRSATDACTLDVGDASDRDRFFDGVGCGLVNVAFSQFGDGTSNGINYRYTSQDTIDVHVLTTTMAVGTEVNLNVSYVMVGTIRDEI